MPAERRAVQADPAAGSLAWIKRYLERRYTILFYTLLFTLVASPILSALKFSGVVIESLLAANLLVAVFPVTTVRRRPMLLAAMTLVWLARLLTVRFDYHFWSAITLGVWTVIGLLAAAAALRFAMRAIQVDGEHLYAALSAYLLAGIFFGLLYFVLEQISPGTFTLTGRFSQTSAIYFSFVTLATLGYGDISPHGDVARGMSIIEGIGGQLFLAVLVARLVSLYSKPASDSG